MNNVVPLHGEGSWPHTIRKLEQTTEVYRGIIISLCDDIDRLVSCIDLMADPFRQHDIEKLTDRVRAQVERHRLVVDA